MIFNYVNIIEYLCVGDTRAPFTRVIDSKKRLKNGIPCEIEPTHRIVFSNVEYKKLLSKNFLSIEIQLRTETGQLVSFAGTGKAILFLWFKNLTRGRPTINSNFFRNFASTTEWFWGLSSSYWQSRIADCNKLLMACSQND